MQPGSVAAMPTPAFVLGLRAHIGHDPLWLSTATGVVLNDAGELLLHRRADTGTWGLPGGIIEPGEERPTRPSGRSSRRPALSRCLNASPP